MDDLKVLNESIKDVKNQLKLLRGAGAQETERVTKMLEAYVEKISTQLDAIESRVSAMEKMSDENMKASELKTCMRNLNET